MPKHLHVGHIGPGLSFDGAALTASGAVPLHHVIAENGEIQRSGDIYFIDTITGPITLTVADNVLFFTIHDTGLNFALHNCIVDFGNGLTSVLNSRGEMAVFFKNASNEWQIRGFGAGIGVPVGGFTLPIVNGGADQGFTGWTQTVGNWENLNFSGRTYFAARFSNIADLQQDVPVPASAVPQIGRGSGSARLELTWSQFSLYGHDQGNITFEFFDATMVSLGTDPGPGLVATAANTWSQRTTGDVQLPLNTQTIRITLQSRHAPGQGFGNYASFDDVAGIIKV